MRYFDLATLSMTPTSGIAESKIGLWWADGTSVSFNTTTEGNEELLDGSSSAGTTNPINAQLFTFSSTWSSNINIAFEATLYCAGSSTTAYASLFDETSKTAISQSQVSTSSTTAAVIRSGKFILTPGHVLSVQAWIASGSSYDAYISDASLIVFPS